MAMSLVRAMHSNFFRFFLTKLADPYREVRDAFSRRNVIREVPKAWMAIVKCGNYNIESIKKAVPFRFLTVSLIRSIESFNPSHFIFFPVEGFQRVFYWLRDPGAGFVYNPYDSRLRAILSLFFAPLYSCPNL